MLSLGNVSVFKELGASCDGDRLAAENAKLLKAALLDIREREAGKRLCIDRYE